MNAQRAVGVVLLVLGVVLLYVGMNSSNSMVDQVSESFTGRFTEKTTWYIVSGIASALTGIILLFVGVRSKLA